MRAVKGNHKKAAKQAVHKHERVMHPGKPLTRLPNGSPSAKAKSRAK